MARSLAQAPLRVISRKSDCSKSTQALKAFSTRTGFSPPLRMDTLRAITSVSSHRV